MALGWTRWPIGFVSVLFALKIASKAIGSAGFGIIGLLLVAVALLVFASVCFSPELSSIAAQPLTKWIDNIYLPGGRPDPAPLNYRLSSYYETTRQFDLAVAEYQRILDDYPQATEAYIGLTRLLATEFDDRRGASRWLKRGMRRIDDQSDRKRLRDAFQELPEHQDERIRA